MSGQTHMLLVEGEADRSFFEAVCKALNLPAKVQVAVPRDAGAKHNSREAVLNALPAFLIQLADGTTEHLAIVLDADHKANGAGYNTMASRVSKIVEPFGFELSSHAENGVLFSHRDGLADFGLWIMPDNTSDGMLEEFIISCIRDTEMDLFNQAKAAVASLSKPKFKPIHVCKAEISTWLAWQARPGHGLYHTIEAKLLDYDRPYFSNLMRWLQHLFAVP